MTQQVTLRVGQNYALWDKTSVTFEGDEMPTELNASTVLKLTKICPNPGLSFVVVSTPERGVVDERVGRVCHVPLDHRSLPQLCAVD